MRITYRGLPLKPTEGDAPFSWLCLPEVLLHIKGGNIEVDGWRFDMDYGVCYLTERRKWGYYLPPGGLKGKTVVDVGGGDGESAKFFIENGASKVIIYEPNPAAWPYLDYNQSHHPEMVVIKAPYDPRTLLEMSFDLLKIDTEGYEVELIPYLDKLTHRDIVVESHSNYSLDKFLEHGFKSLKNVKDRWLRCHMANLYRWAV